MDQKGRALATLLLPKSFAVILAHFLQSAMPRQGAASARPFRSIRSIGSIRSLAAKKARRCEESAPLRRKRAAVKKARRCEEVCR